MPNLLLQGGFVLVAVDVFVPEVEGGVTFVAGADAELDGVAEGAAVGAGALDVPGAADVLEGLAAVEVLGGATGAGTLESAVWTTDGGGATTPGAEGRARKRRHIAIAASDETTMTTTAAIAALSPRGCFRVGAAGAGARIGSQAAVGATA